MRFLIDECLSIDLVGIASQGGFEAQHIARVGRSGWKDWNVVHYAAEGDFVLVTNNATDFRRLYALEPLHAGLIIIIPSVGRRQQRQLFRAALQELAVIGEPINRVLEVNIVADNVTFTLYEHPLRNLRSHASSARRKIRRAVRRRGGRRAPTLRGYTAV